MFFVYAISSLCRNYIYVGMTDNLERRVQQHNDGKKKTTKPYLPYILLYSESIDNRIDARTREKYWKSGTGKRQLRQMRESLNK
ncbi:GIY-YIG nuclease family protein [Altibacter lentus]|uniref:GIY-YIG nuclease family protein n=1 Tax=Altibacter lentus TaxID=1223410 RepID=UPI0005546767|nr:GIY-YIG nuclease family protein [Altibacter lentus]